MIKIMKLLLILTTMVIQLILKTNFKYFNRLIYYFIIVYFIYFNIIVKIIIYLMGTCINCKKDTIIILNKNNEERSKKFNKIYKENSASSLKVNVNNFISCNDSSILIKKYKNIN